MIIKQDFYFHALNAHRPLHIRLPDAGEPPFPVMYFFDGHNLFRDEDATYGKSWGLDAYCAAWDKPVIIVGMECAHEGNRRISEYLPYRTGYGWLRGAEPPGEATMQALIFELKPYIDSAFPTIPFRECTAIGGSSMGGLMAAYALVKYNALISKAACLSPSIGSVSGKLWHDMNSTVLSPDTRIYLSWGTMEGYGGITNPSGGGQVQPAVQNLPGNGEQGDRGGRRGKAVLPGGRAALRSRLGEADPAVHALSVAVVKQRF